MSTSVQADVNTLANPEHRTVADNWHATDVKTMATVGHSPLQGAHVMRPLTVAHKYPAKDTT